MDAPTVKDRIRVAWEAAWDRGEVDALDEIFAPGFTRTNRATTGVMSVEDLKHAITATRLGFPDLRTRINHLLVEGDKAAIFWESDGTHENEMFGVPPTHRRVQTFGCNFCDLVDGRVAGEEVTWDPRQLLAVLGITTLGDDE